MIHFAATDFTYIDPYTTTSSSSGSGGMLLAGLGVFSIVIYVAMFALLVAPYWRMFTKANIKGWKALIPIYNLYLACKAVGKPGWWTLLLLIPVINIPFLILLYHAWSKAFGHGKWVTFLGFIGYGVFIVAYSHDKFTSPVTLLNAPNTEPPAQPQQPVQPLASVGA